MAQILLGLAGQSLALVAQSLLPRNGAVAQIRGWWLREGVSDSKLSLVAQRWGWRLAQSRGCGSKLKTILVILHIALFERNDQPNPFFILFDNLI